MDEDATIAFEKYVILKNEKMLKPVLLKKNAKLWFEKTWFHASGAVGKPFGSKFEISNNQLVTVLLESKSENSVACQGFDEKDNRDLHDRDVNQKLNRESIEEFRKDGLTGKEIISQLIDNSTTFNDKTQFSQEKYLKKKTKKHLKEFVILRPTERLISELCYSRGPRRICNLRNDSLAQMLNYANIKSSSRVIVVESCQGLVTGCVLNRLAGCGKLVMCHTGSDAVVSTLQFFNFSPQHLQPLLKFPLNELANISGSKKQKLEEIKACIHDGVEIAGIAECDKSEFGDSCLAKNEAGEVAMKECTSEHESNGASLSAEKSVEKLIVTSEESDKIELRNERRKRKRENCEEAQRELLEGKFEGLIVACNYEFVDLLLRLLPFVSSGRPIVLFSPFQRQIVNAFDYLRTQKIAGKLLVTESWLRYYQVLPNRTHPNNQMSTANGYLLTGLTVQADG